MGASMPDDFETMWRDLAPVGRVGVVRRLLPAAVDVRGARAAGVVRASRRSARGLAVRDRRLRQPVGLVGRRRRRLGARRADRLAPRLGARRRGVRRPARRGLGARGASTCCGRAGSCRRGRSGSSVFVEEEGSRFGLACLGSRLATGATGLGGGARAARPRRGGPADALEAAGLTRARGVGAARRRSARVLDGVGCFVELHVEQGRDLVDRGAAVGRGQRDLAARALPLRLHRRGQPRGHDPDGGPAPTRCSPTR